jgi:4-alpha-glucanotransferase
MSTSEAAIDQWGVLAEFKDAFGNSRKVSRETRRLIQRAMAGEGKARPLATTVRTHKQGTPLVLSAPAELVLEDGNVLRGERRFQRDLPMGYHEIRYLADGRRERLLVSPGACYLPPHLHLWGWAIQLYALRSRQSWGMGDLADLKDFCHWTARELQCGFCLVNPLSAAIPIVPQQASPYYPSSRCFLNPLYLRIEDIPNSGAPSATLERLAEAGKALNSRRLIDRDEVFRLKYGALKKIWERGRPAKAFEEFSRRSGPAYRQFATFCALAQHFGAGWRQWPAGFRSPHSPEVRKYREEAADKIQFHQWIQWLLQRQMKQVTAELPVIQDLPIGVDPTGADAWLWQDQLAQGVSVGAPPDAYNPQGQNWGMQPFNPHALQDSFFEPFRLAIRTVLQYGGGVRIDHVMGLFRLFWIPEGKSGGQGAYVHYPMNELLAILAIESHRAKALVIGEDLGTVEPAMRRELRRRNVLSYRLLWFESQAVRRFPRKALTAVSTHDLFTLAGLWNGGDFKEQQRLGLKPDPADQRKLVNRLCRQLGIKPAADIEEVIFKTYEMVAATPSMLLAASLDDVLKVNERPNIPGTLNRPNWCLALPLCLEEIRRLPDIKKIARVIKAVRQSNASRK